MQRQQSVKSVIVAAGLWAALGAMLCTPIGCKKSADDAVSESNDASNDGASVSDGDAGEPDDANEPIDPSMFNQVKSMMQLQVDSIAVQSQTLHQMLAENPDAQATELVNQMDARIAEAKKLMEKATSPAQSRSLKVDAPRLVGEAGELGGKAMARIQEVLRAKFGGPG